MARQILPLIDSRTQAQREGRNETLENLQRILQTLGQAEKVRRDRQTLDRITRAISSGATDIEAIANVAGMEPEMGRGLPGILQRIGGMYQPQGADSAGQGIQKMILGQRLKQMLTPKFEAPSGGFAEGTITQRGPTGRVKVLQQPEAGTALAPYEQTKADKALDRDIEILTKKHKTGDKKGKLIATPIQQEKARERQRRNPGLRDVSPGRTDYMKKVKGKSKISVGIFDKAYGEEAYNETLQEAKDDGLAKGATEASVEADFNAWWDKQAAEERERGDKYFEFIPRDEFQDVAGETKDISNTDVRLQSAPDMRLDPFWGNLPDEEKKEIIQRLDEDPKNIEAILKILQSG